MDQTEVDRWKEYVDIRDKEIRRLNRRLNKLKEKTVDQTKMDFLDKKTRQLNKRNEELLDELEFLRFFYQQADFGPASDDIFSMIREDYMTKTKRECPVGYREDE